LSFELCKSPNIFVQSLCLLSVAASLGPHESNLHFPSRYRLVDYTVSFTSATLLMFGAEMETDGSTAPLDTSCGRG
jgi:hypothetical protein